jgi:UDP-N-acetylmuramyl pentapeptide synthase
MPDGNETVLLAKSRMAETSPAIIGVFGGFARKAAASLIEGALSRSFEVCSGLMVLEDVADCARKILAAPRDATAFVWEMESASQGAAAEFLKNFPVTHAVITDAPEKRMSGFLGISKSAALVSLYYNSDAEAIAPAPEGINKRGVGFSGGIKIKEARQDMTGSCGPGLYVTISIGGEEYSCYANLFGRQNARNMSFALSVALDLGVSPEDIRSGMAEAHLSPGVGNVYRAGGGGFMIDETSCSCLDSVSHSIKDLIELDAPLDTVKIAILGGMRGLGGDSGYWHDVVMSRACLLDGVYLIGEEWDEAVTGQPSLRGKWAGTDAFLRDFDMPALEDAVTLVNDSGFYDMDKIVQAACPSGDGPS